MSLWLCRAGKHGEHEKRFFDTNRIYLTWEGLEKENLGKAGDLKQLKSIMRKAYPTVSDTHLGRSAGQVWTFVKDMNAGDWIVVPRKTTPSLAFAEIAGGYEFDDAADGAYQHSRKVRWLNMDVPRSTVDQDLLYSFGSLLTICEIRRNDAERRIRKLAGDHWGVNGSSSIAQRLQETEALESAEEATLDLEQLGRDEIAKFINAKFKGHGLARLVESVLKAQGYTTYRSPEGPDSGVDLLASPGPLGFGQPRICVQVKSSDSPVDSPTLNQLIGTMQNMHADQGLLVSWGGFKSSIAKEVPRQFFKVRMWDQTDLITEIFDHYNELDEDVRAELPLKRIWTIAADEEG
jgi:restriction system protein